MTSVTAHRGRPGSDTFRHLAIALDEKVAFLSRPGSYPGPVAEVEAIETHMAWVFLAGDFAYKLKKPVFRADQDFSTIDARKRDNTLEVTLNRPLAEDVYLANEPLNVDGDGTMALGGAGQPCDWLIKMRRLPRDSMLDQSLPENRTGSKAAGSIATRLKHFYRQRAPVAMSFAEYRERFHRGIETNRRLIARQEAPLAERIRNLCRQQQAFIDAEPAVLDDALRQNRVVEAHGDLRPEHVCVRDGVRIIDCLEFCRDYRLQDYLDDLAFLALECERLGRAEFGERIVQGVAADSDVMPHALIGFYKSYRAAVRARLALLHWRTITATTGKNGWDERTLIWAWLKITLTTGDNKSLL